MKTIIVPTDFSPIATNAMNFAADMATNINASLMLLHVYQVPVSMTDVPVVMVSAEELRKSSEAKLQEIKDAVTHITSGKLKFIQKRGWVMFLMNSKMFVNTFNHLL
jgi:nucleotide-binding universal stress UspA family protein